MFRCELVFEVDAVALCVMPRCTAADYCSARRICVGNPVSFLLGASGFAFFVSFNVEISARSLFHLVCCISMTGVLMCVCTSKHSMEAVEKTRNPLESRGMVLQPMDRKRGVS